MKKRCSKCKHEISVSLFNRCSARADGLSNYCKSCACLHARAWQIANQAQDHDNKKRWKSKNQDKIRRSLTKWHDKNPTYQHNYDVKRYRENRDRERCRNTEWRRNNHARVLSNNARRDAARRRRAPVWLNVDQRKTIEEFYITARELSWLSDGGLHVDHIVPLRGRTVSGLHVPWNLQIIPAEMNLRKGNRL